MKKLILLMGGAIFLSTSAFAYRDMDERLDSLETQMKEISSTNPQETLGAAFTTSRPETKNTRFFGFMDVIYWHPKMGGTEYAYTGDYSIDLSVPQKGPIIRALPPKGDVKENDFGWDLGLKAGLGYKTPHDSWDLLGRYTWLSSHDSSSHQKTVPSNLFSIRSILAIPCRRVKSHVEIELNNLEVELARSYFLSKYFSVRPHFDLKSSWIDMGQKIHYTYSSLVSERIREQESKVTESCRFWGLGPRAGLDGSLYLGDGFSLVGEVAGSILYGHFKSRMKENFPEVENSRTPTTLYSVKHNFHRFVPFVQMFLGFKWNTYLNSHRQFLQLKAGYEAQYYWRMNQMLRTGGLVSDNVRVTTGRVFTTVSGSRTAFEPISEDLMFYGITGEARLDF